MPMGGTDKEKILLLKLTRNHKVRPITIMLKLCTTREQDMTSTKLRKAIYNYEDDKITLLDHSAMLCSMTILPRLIQR